MTVVGVVVSLGLLSGCSRSLRLPVAVHGSSKSAAPRTAPTSAAQGQPILGPGAWKTLRVRVSDSAQFRDVLVFTPDVRDPNQLPVLYLLHGLPGNARGLCTVGAGRELDAAFAAGARPFVMACPDGSVTTRSDSEWADSMDAGDRLETFVTEQALRAVEAGHIRARSMRAIAGLSMGGFGAAAIALRHPTLYSQVVPMAGYFVIDDPDHVFGTMQTSLAAHNPTELVARAGGQRWFLFQAASDPYPLTADAGARFLPMLRQVAAKAQVLTTPGTHSNAWAVAQLALAARLMSSGWGVG